MIVSAISLWKKFDVKKLESASVWGAKDEDGIHTHHVTYDGHAVKDGAVRIYARFGRPSGTDKKPAVLLLSDVGKAPDLELMNYFIEKGYAVLMPDYSGKMKTDETGVMRTIYPDSLSYGNYEQARGLEDMEGLEAEETTWFEWAYVALYSVAYLKSRADIGNIGVVGVRLGGALAWQTMLSPDIKCGIPINAAGWHSFLNIGKFGDTTAHNLSDDRHRYIAAVEAQSYAPYVKCPVLMLCALRDSSFDCDRAYDTYSRIGNQEENALAYSFRSGACIGPHALNDMNLFLEKNLKGREIYIPDTLNVRLEETQDGVQVFLECDKEGILEEAGVFYAEADVKTKSTYREWRKVFKTEGRLVKNGKTSCIIKPFEGATAVFVYAYAKYINGFRVMSKIVSKRLSKSNANAVKSRMVFTGKEMDCFGVLRHEEYSIGEVFMERAAIPKAAEGYGGIKGAYSVGGIKTYKISSPMYIPDDGALLEFDVYSAETQTLEVAIEIADMEADVERYVCKVEVRGGGKWKRNVLKAADFKSESSGMPLRNFNQGSALSFACADEEEEFSVTNILWL